MASNTDQLPTRDQADGIIDLLTGLHHLQAELLEVVRLGGGHLASVTGSEAPQPQPDELTEGYFRRSKLARDAGGWLFQLLYLVGFWAPVTWEYKWGDVDTDEWIDDQIVRYPYYIHSYVDAVHSKHFTNFYIQFHDVSLVAASDGGIWYGDPRTVDSETDEIKGQAFVIDLEHFDHDAEHVISRTETLTRSVSHTMDKKFSSSTTEELSGNIPGVGFEAKVSVTLGFELDDSTTEAMDTSISQTISDSLISPKRHKTLILFNKAKQRIVTPFELRAVYDYGFAVHWPGWDKLWGHGNTYRYRIGVDTFRGGRGYWNADNYRGGSDVLSFANLAEFRSFIVGSDPRYPAMIGFLDALRKLGSANVFDLPLSEAKRRFELSGERNQDYDDTVTYAVSDVTGVSDEELRRLHGDITTLGPGDGLPRWAWRGAVDEAYWKSTNGPQLVVREHEGQLVTTAA